jgi:lipoate-protein ligase A
MAIDHAVAQALRPEEGVLRLYLWDRPTLSFGRNEPARGLYDTTSARKAGVAFVRRPTGGRVVLHHEELTYAVAVAVGAVGGLRETYRIVNRALAAALHSLGAPVGLAAAPGSAAHPGAGPCFDAPAEGEVVARGQKLVGSAQVRMGRTILQHGSIILAGDQRLIATLGPVAVSRPPATLEALLGSVPPRPALETALVAAFEAVLGGRWDGDELTDAERTSASRLEARYRSADWTWRR